MDELLFVCINYKNEEEVKNFLLNIKRTIKNKKEVIVINNSLTKDLEKLLKIDNLSINIFTPNKNLGYLNGLFYGINEYKKLKTLPQWIVLSNTDIEIKNFDFTSTNYSDEVWCIAPNIYSVHNQSYQNPFYNIRLKKNKIERIIFIKKNVYIDMMYEKIGSLKRKIVSMKNRNSSYIYAPHGSFFLLKKEFFLIKEQKYFSFLYGEEIFIAEELRKLKKKIYFDKNLKIYHLEHSTTNLLKRKIRNKFLIESLIKILKKYY
ncbi:hypothetical protein I6E31_01475 [Fusobacterium varium]|nr:hypothetical protein [Fusobacterium varium]